MEIGRDIEEKRARKNKRRIRRKKEREEKR